MKINRLILATAASGLLAVSAQAQTNEQLQQALAQAQAAAAQAQAAAAKAQAALEQVLATVARAQQDASAQAKPAAEASKDGSLTFKSGANSVTLYGLIDATVSNRSNANAAGQSVTGYQDAWFSGNRVGLTGSHDFGNDGLKAIFRLESEFNYRDGVNPDSPSLFNRDAWVGLESDSIGKLTFGRQNTLPRDFSQNYGDPYGTAAVNLNEGGWTNNNNFKQMIFYAGSATGTRYNDGLVWKKKFGDKIVAGLGYQFGGIPGDSSRGSTQAAALAYNGGAFNVSGFVNSANVAGLKNRSYSVGGNYQFDLVRLNAGYFNYTADQFGALGSRSDTGVTVSAKFTPVGKFDYELGYQVMSANNAAVNGSGYVINAFGNTAAATKTGTGKRKTLYGSVFYRLDTSTDLYFALDKMDTTDTYLAATANGAKTQTGVALGLRFKF